MTLPVFCLGLIVGLGCDSGPKMTTIQGTVTLDGQPVKQGTIRFQPKDNTGNPAEAIIADGKYSVSVVVTKHAVEIRSSRPKPNAPKRGIEGPGADAVVMEESIPAKYNVATELIADVTSGKSTFDFPLTSSP